MDGGESLSAHSIINLHLLLRFSVTDSDRPHKIQSNFGRSNWSVSNTMDRWNSFVSPDNFPIYYIPITDTTLELSVFWPSDKESRINELRFSESISLSFKTRLT